MRIAVTVGVLRVPPSYFVTEHARLLSGHFDFGFFARAADVASPMPGPLEVPRLTSPPSTHLRRLMALLSVISVVGNIRRFRPDVIHQHFATWAGPSLLASRLLRVPLVVTLHGYDVMRPQGASLARRIADAMHRRGLRRLVRRGAYFLAVSEFLRGEAVRRGVPPEQIDVLRMGVDVDYYTPEGRDAQSALNDRSIVWVGRAVPEKGGEDLLRAVAATPTLRSARVIFIGNGPVLGEWKALATELGIDAEFCGQVDRTAVRQTLRRATVAVLPTKEKAGCREAAGLVLLEAQACGVPVVTYASGGTLEMVDAPASGHVVPERDVEELGGKIADVLALDLDEYNAMCRNARVHAATRGSAAIAAERLGRIYRSIA